MRIIDSSRLFAVLAWLALAGLAQAQTAPSASAPRSPASAAARQWPLSRGEVLEIDAKEKRVTIKHGPIPNIGMDAMTMEFLVPDDKLLASLKPGDRVRFAVIYRGGDYVITRAQVQQRRGAPRAAKATRG